MKNDNDILEDSERVQRYNEDAGRHRTTVQEGQAETLEKYPITDEEEKIKIALYEQWLEERKNADLEAEKLRDKEELDRQWEETFGVSR